MRKLSLAVAFLAIAASATAQRVTETNPGHIHLYPSKDKVQGWAKPGGGKGQNLVYWGGPVIT